MRPPSESKFIPTQTNDTDAPAFESQHIDMNSVTDRHSLEPHSDNSSATSVQTKASDVADFMQDIDPDLMEKFGRFRILIIGRANAGKTTILHRICNSTEGPEIYDSQGEKVRLIRLRYAGC